ncbi:MAG: DNA-directed RNA polymerase subunit D [Candidatus Thermoplasmatota archaeon]|nr:DNA-directed RNA polymerase subunit D [Candidatus Thermoplasmatota archaeon]
MKVVNAEFKHKKGVIHIEGTAPYFINSLRRIMIADLPKLAVDDVIIYDNTSALFDEIISHRLGLIPIPTDLELLIFRDECSCKGKGCPNCTVRYTLSKEGAGVVYSGDLQPAEKSWAIKEDKIPIVELFNDQRLILEVEAVLGRGKTQAKWQAVQAPGYKFMPTINFDKKKINEVKEFVKTLEDGLLTLKGEKLEILDIDKISVLEFYLHKNNVDFIEIKRDNTNIIFSFETDGALSAEDALINSLKILEEKYADFGKLLDKLK